MECYYCGKDCETQKIEVYNGYCKKPNERDVCEDCLDNLFESCVICCSLQDDIVYTDWYQMTPYEEYDDNDDDYDGYKGHDRSDVVHFFETQYYCDKCIEILFENMSWLEIYEKCKADRGKNGMLLLWKELQNTNSQT